MNAITSLLGSPEFVNLLMTVLTVVLPLLLAKISSRYLTIVETDKAMVKTGKLISQAILAAIDSTYQCFVRVWKENSKDGKLTAEQKKAALRIALDYTKKFAISSGIDIAKEYSDDLLTAMIEDYITNRKTAAAPYKSNQIIAESMEEKKNEQPLQLLIPSQESSQTSPAQQAKPVIQFPGLPAEKLTPQQ